MSNMGLERTSQSYLEGAETNLQDSARWDTVLENAVGKISSSFASLTNTWVVQRYLDWYKERTLPSPEVLRVYSNNYAAIQAIYSQKPRFHGTGRFRYATGGESKYDTGIVDDQIDDVLEQILTRGGIFPHSDPFVGIVSEHQKMDSQGIQLSTSLSNSRVIAGLYAETHQNSSDPLQYLYGHPTFWRLFYLANSILAAPISGSKDCLRVAFNSQYREYYTKWLRAIDGNEEGFLKMIQGTPIYPFAASLKSRTRIAQNHGLIFGIQPDSVFPLPIPNFFSRFESRISDPILLDQITHVEVPLSRIDEVATKLRGFGLNMPVLPVECTEWYLAQHQLEELTPWG